MARANRLERLDKERQALELEYEAALIEALRQCAAGSWGLFDHRQDRQDRSKWQASVAALCDLGADIDAKRAMLWLEPFALHQEFEASRGPVAATAPGEPKQARAWLERLTKAA